MDDASRSHRYRRPLVLAIALLVVIAAGGHGLLGTPAGDAVVAFALPEQ